MLKLAVQAGLPLIAITSDDLVNTTYVLSHVIAPKELNTIPVKQTSKGWVWDLPKAKPGAVWVWDQPTLPKRHVELYEEFMGRRETLILVNPGNHFRVAYDGGHLVPPHKMISEFVAQYIKGTNKINETAYALRGMSFKDVIEVSKLAMTQYGEYSARTVSKIRNRLAKLPTGLVQVATEQPFYKPSEELVGWLTVNEVLLGSSDCPPQILPKGLMFRGQPGTGKTAGAKYLANRLGLPLYRVEMAGVLSKYHGESDQRLREVLEQADEAAPCVLLLDEVEKLFKSESAEGIVERLLAQLLWWLQEHKSRVLTLMTTNDVNAIPPELYREGRIDAVVSFYPMNGKEATAFAAEVNASLPEKIRYKDTIEFFTEEYELTPAAVTERLMVLVREQYKNHLTHGCLTDTVPNVF